MHEIAFKLNGIKYNTIYRESELFSDACQKDLIIIYGISDDLIELSGALDEEFDVYNLVHIGNDTQTIYLGISGDVFKLSRKKLSSNDVVIKFDNNGLMWDITAPHAAYFYLKSNSDNKPYSRGIVVEAKNYR